MTLHLHHLSVSEMDNNCYLLIDRPADEGGQDTRERRDPALLIDAADDADALLAWAEGLGARIECVVTTHSHWDHVRATEEVLRRTGAAHVVPAPDADDIPGPHTQVVDDGDEVVFGEHRFPVRILRGHTRGGLVLFTRIGGEEHLFVGDNIFPGGLGKTDSPEAFASLFADATQRVFNEAPDDAVVLPGHGKPTTIGAERPHLAEWEQRGW